MQTTSSTTFAAIPKTNQKVSNMKIINAFVNWIVMQWHLLGLWRYQISEFFRSEDDYRVLVLSGKKKTLIIHALSCQRPSQQLCVSEIRSTSISENTVLVEIEEKIVYYFECTSKAQALKLEREIVMHVFQHLFG